MSKASRARFFARQNRMKAVGTVPTLLQQETVQRNPFVPPSVEPHKDATVVSHAKLTTEYIPSRTSGYYPFLMALPPYVDDISQQFGLKVYDQMKTDAAVYSSYRVFPLAMLANGWELIPSLTRDNLEYDEALKMRDFVQECIENLETPYDLVLEQHLDSSMRYGCGVNEQLYETDRKGLLRLKDIRQKPLINSIFVVDSFYNTIGILTQRFPGQAYPAGSFIPIDFAMLGQGTPQHAFDISDIIPGFLPRDKFSILTNEMQYNDERGQSTLRAAYPAWWWKQQVLSEWLSHLSKFGSPSIIGKTAENAQPQQVLDANLNVMLGSDGKPLQITPESTMAQQIAQFQNGGGIVIPKTAELEIIQATSSGEAFTQAMLWADKQVVRAITYQELATTEGIHQARASSDTHQDILSLGILRRKIWFANQQRREVFKRLLAYNFDITGERIAHLVPKLNLGFGDGMPITVDNIAQLFASNYFGANPDPGQMQKLDALLRIPIREAVNQFESDMGKASQERNEFKKPEDENFDEED